MCQKGRVRRRGGDENPISIDNCQAIISKKLEKGIKTIFKMKSAEEQFENVAVQIFLLNILDNLFCNF